MENIVLTSTSLILKRNSRVCEQIHQVRKVNYDVTNVTLKLKKLGRIVENQYIRIRIAKVSPKKTTTWEQLS